VRVRTTAEPEDGGGACGSEDNGEAEGSGMETVGMRTTMEPDQDQFRS